MTQTRNTSEGIATAGRASCAIASLCQVCESLVLLHPTATRPRKHQLVHDKSCPDQVLGPKSSPRRPVPGALGHILRGGTGASLSACTRSHTRPPPVEAVGDRHLPLYPGACRRGFQLRRPLAGNQEWNIQLRRQRRWKENSFGKVSVVRDEVRWSVAVRKLRARAWRNQGQGLESKLSNAWPSPCAKGSQQAHGRGCRESTRGDLIVTRRGWRESTCGDVITTRFPHSSHKGVLTHCLS